MRPLLCLCAFATILFTLLSSNLSYSASNKTPKISQQPKLKIFSAKGGNYDVEKEEIFISGGVKIEYGKTQIKGEKLIFKSKNKLAVLSGSPVTLIDNNLTLSAANAEVDFKNNFARTTQKSDILYKTATSEITLTANSFYFKMDTEDLNTKGNITFEYISKENNSSTIHNKNQKLENRKQKTEDTSSTYSTSINTSQILITTEELDYNFSTKKIKISKEVKVKTPDLLLLLPFLEGSFDDKIFTSENGVQIILKDVEIKGNSLLYDEGNKRITIQKNVEVQKQDNRMLCDKVVVDFTKEKNSIKMFGNVKVIITVPDNKK